MLKRDDLTKSDKELLETLIRKEPAALTDKEKEILQARRNYLTKEEYETLFPKVAEEKKSNK